MAEEGAEVEAAERTDNRHRCSTRYLLSLDKYSLTELRDQERDGKARNSHMAALSTVPSRPMLRVAQEYASLHRAGETALRRPGIGPFLLAGRRSEGLQQTPAMTSRLADATSELPYSTKWV